MTHNLRSFLDLPKLLTGVLLLGGCSSQNPAAPSVTPDAAQTHTPAIPIGVSSVAPSVPEYAVSRPMLDKLDSITCGARAKLSLCQLVSNLGKVTGLCFELDDEALRAEGLSGDLLIAVEDDASLLTGLRSALMSHRLDLIVRGKCVVITSAVRAEATQCTATFSLAPLVNDEMGGGSVSDSGPRRAVAERRWGGGHVDPPSRRQAGGCGSDIVGYANIGAVARRRWGRTTMSDLRLRQLGATLFALFSVQALVTATTMSVTCDESGHIGGGLYISLQRVLTPLISPPL